ncbi:bifunctional PIG-L family deacetylase/class I SAM-dependent methyltransferase [Actinokineospora auranticolor]|uniref:LmbE family N-acetylglucosaminyl deacetylase n=1 Tax=Actinokineospora auranticolor TaxID=155976 RepID=A0A2S6GIK3_9PSEU|nr:bifunctional PIG-L family deacetylase/class I SAM-dependent methyltransferase [Actinokineospora auranticolor]PPK65045.1 LmbE family N-acetylglucosaminyl deacetylase [Actinokineospora auranticolor]
MRQTTDEDEWASWLTGLRRFPDERYDLAVVVAAHPDDETLGASGLIQALHERGTEVRLVVATDGEAAFPTLSPAERADLGRARRQELTASLRAQGLGEVEVRWLGLPDSGLTGRRVELAGALVGELADADLCLVPWPGDPHPDHQCAGEVALQVAPVTAHRWSYPIWMWHWLKPDDRLVRRERAFTIALDRGRRERKAAGIARFVSQVEPGPEGVPILDTAMLSHFDRDVEVVFREPPRASAPVDRFADLYAAHTDPWSVTDSWYERRKRAVTLACLPEQRYGTVVEPACGIGQLTVDLAARCERLTAFDPVPVAVDRARTRTAHLPHVRIEVGALPRDLPDEPADLVVFSEILYYLGDTDLDSTVDKAVAALRPGGHLLAAHWLPWAAEAPRDGMDAHRRLLAHPDLDPLVEHLDHEFAVHVLRRR